MIETATITPLTSLNHTEKASEDRQQPQPGESALWFRRYLLYRNLGHKRSLRAAIAKERETAHLLKEPQKATQPKRGKTQGNLSDSRTPTRPEAPPAHVPGSWKAASKTFSWSERAKAFDAWLLAEMNQFSAEHLGDTYANKYKRVLYLDALIRSVKNQLEQAVEKGTTHQAYQNYIKLLAKLLGQMEAEMHQPEDMQTAIAAHTLAIQDEAEQAYQQGRKSFNRKF